MTEIGKVYGEALYSLAFEEDLAAHILHQLITLDKCFAPDFIQLLSTPTLSKAHRCQILDESFRGRLQPYVLNFLKILTEKGYMCQFHNCVEAYREKYYQDNAILPVTAVTAVHLTDKQKHRLIKRMHAITGKHIELSNRLDPSVLGGIRLDYNGKRADDTVSHRLDVIRNMLKNAAH